jgi:ribonuclease HI
MTNNVVEYEALINGLCITTELGVLWLYIRGNSELVVNELMGESNCHDSYMVAYRQEVRRKRSTVLRSIISSNETAKQPTPFLGQAENYPLQ